MPRTRRTRTLDWLLGRPRPSRPPGALRQPVVAHPGTSGISCSGGGIRSAAYNLGALQVLRERGIFQSADYLSAVSGGSYIAASHAIVAATSKDQLGDVPVYAAGSPEERWLRNHSTYLAPDATVKLRLALNLLYGLVSNLTMLWLVLFVVARPLGWAYRTLHPGLADAADPTFSPGTATWLIVGGLALSGFLLVFAERMLDRRKEAAPYAVAFLRAWSTRTVVLSAVVALLLLLVPVAVLALWEAGRSDLLGGAVREALSALGFTGERDGVSSVQLPVLAAALVTVVGVVTRSVRAAAGLVGSRIGRALLPWVGSLLMSMLLVLPFLKWTKDAALASSWATEIAWELAALTALVLHGVYTNINRTSMHPFYKERLCSAFATQRTSSTEAQELPYSVPIRLSSLDTRGHVPDLLVCAAANVSQLHDVPPGRGCVSFTFSARECGAPSLAPMVPTATYERVVGARTLTLPGAVAVSGAAVSPAMGRFTRPSLRLLLTLANVRLGIWLPNPARRDSWPPEEQTGAGSRRRDEAARAVRRRSSEPGPFALLREILGRNRWDDEWLYVSDGGHWENLGLLELLRRGCTTIYAVDASGDAPDSFSTLGQAIALARTELGVEIDLDPTTMVTDPETGWARCDHAVGSVRYPDGSVGRIGVVKLAVTADAPWDVRAYKHKDPVFPLHSTIDQLYVDERFEAYRSLGRHAAGNLVRAMEAARVISLPSGHAAAIPAPTGHSLPNRDTAAAEVAPTASPPGLGSARSAPYLGA